MIDQHKHDAPETFLATLNENKKQESENEKDPEADERANLNDIANDYTEFLSAHNKNNSSAFINSNKNTIQVASSSKKRNQNSSAAGASKRKQPHNHHQRLNSPNIASAILGSILLNEDQTTKTTTTSSSSSSKSLLMEEVLEHYTLFRQLEERDEFLHDPRSFLMANVDAISKRDRNKILEDFYAIDPMFYRSAFGVPFLTSSMFSVTENRFIANFLGLTSSSSSSSQSHHLSSSPHSVVVSSTTSSSIPSTAVPKSSGSTTSTSTTIAATNEMHKNSSSSSMMNNQHQHQQGIIESILNGITNGLAGGDFSSKNIPPHLMISSPFSNSKNNRSGANHRDGDGNNHSSNFNYNYFSSGADELCKYSSPAMSGQILRQTAVGRDFAAVVTPILANKFNIVVDRLNREYSAANLSAKVAAPRQVFIARQCENLLRIAMLVFTGYHNGSEQTSSVSSVSPAFLGINPFLGDRQRQRHHRQQRHYQNDNILHKNNNNVSSSSSLSSPGRMLKAVSETLSLPSSPSTLLPSVVSRPQQHHQQQLNFGVNKTVASSAVSGSTTATIEFSMHFSVVDAIAENFQLSSHLSWRYATLLFGAHHGLASAVIFQNLVLPEAELLESIAHLLMTTVCSESRLFIDPDLQEDVSDVEKLFSDPKLVQEFSKAMMIVSHHTNNRGNPNFNTLSTSNDHHTNVAPSSTVSSAPPRFPSSSLPPSASTATLAPLDGGNNQNTVTSVATTRNHSRVGSNNNMNSVGLLPSKILSSNNPTPQQQQFSSSSSSSSANIMFSNSDGESEKLISFVFEILSKSCHAFHSGRGLLRGFVCEIEKLFLSPAIQNHDNHHQHFHQHSSSHSVLPNESMIVSSTAQSHQHPAAALSTTTSTSISTVTLTTTTQEDERMNAGHSSNSLQIASFEKLQEIKRILKEILKNINTNDVIRNYATGVVLGGGCTFACQETKNAADKIINVALVMCTVMQAAVAATGM